MNLKLNSHHVEITPAMRSHLENKLTKIVHHFDLVAVVDTLVLALILNAQ